MTLVLNRLEVSTAFLRTNEFLTKAFPPRFMRIRFVEAKEGGATTVMDYKEELTRIGGILHGGIIFYR